MNNTTNAKETNKLTKRSKRVWANVRIKEASIEKWDAREESQENGVPGN